MQEFYKSLADEQKEYLEEADRALLDRLCTKRPSQIIDGLEETTKKAWLKDFGASLLRLHQTYSAHSSPRYELIERLLLEQYRIDSEEQRVDRKPSEEITADSLQSPPDEEAVYRKKKDETCVVIAPP
jgi:hypothetical protein